MSEELAALQDFVNLLGVSELTEDQWQRYIHLLRNEPKEEVEDLEGRIEICKHDGCDADMTAWMCPNSHRKFCLDHCGHEDH
jgi:hypothetical protein